MATGFSVQIDDLRAAAAGFAQMHADAAGLLSADGLGGTAGMAGRDPVLAAWRARYDAVAAEQWAASVAAVATLDAIATKLADTADTYLAADHAATPGAPRVPQGPPGGAEPPDSPGSDPSAGTTGSPPRPNSPGDTGPSGRPDPPAGQPPSSTGSAGPDVPDALAAYFPGGDPALLRMAAAAWSGLGEGVDRIAYQADTAFRQLSATGEGAAFSAMREFWARRFADCATDPLFNAAANGAGLLGTSCAALADLIERTRAEVRGAAAEAVRDMSPLELPAELLSEIAWGIPELELLVGTGALAVAYLNDYRNAYLYALDRLVERLGPEAEQRLRRVAVPPAPDAPVGEGLTDVGQITGLGLTGTRWDTVHGPHPTPDAIHIAPQQVTHVLRGDGRGGGHAPGTEIPGKTEFPPGWSDAQVLAATLSVARAPDRVVPARQGRLLAEGTRDGVLIRVVLRPDGDIVTSVPLAGPGVVRNPGRR